MRVKYTSLFRSVLAAAGVAIMAVFMASAPAAAGTNSLDSEIFGIAVGGAIQGEDTATLTRDLDAIADAGARWVRLDINWAVVQAGGPSSYNWTPTDRLVQGAIQRDMKVLGVILYTPGWHRSNPTKPPDPSAYASFARKAVERYAPMGVHAYEVWNEPNVSAFWSSPNPAAYTQLLKAAYPAIKSADPQATVLTGGTAPSYTDGTNYWPADFLKGIYANGGRGSFDAVSHHPYCFPAMPGDPESWSAWHVMNGSQARDSDNGVHWGGPSLREVMVANGEGDKKIWGTEFGAPTNGPNRVSESDQAQAVTRAYKLWQTYDWAGPLFTYQGRDLGTDTSTRENFFGLLRHNFAPKPAYAAYRASAAAAGALDGVAPGGRTKVELRAKRRGKRSGKVKGRVLVVSGASKAQAGVSAGTVKLRLLEKSRRGWRAKSHWRRARLGASGRFDRRLARLKAGKYRVRARYPGSRSARPATALSRDFRIRHG